MAFLEKSRRKNLVKKLKKDLFDYKTEPNQTKEQNLQICLTKFAETMNLDEFKKDSLPQTLNEGLYKDDIIDFLINMMPCFEQTTLNAASTLLQTTIREFPENSLAKYVLKKPEILQILLSYFEHPKILNISHTLIKSCTNVKSFTKFCFETGVVGSFIQYLFGDSFDKISTAFGTYDALITTHLDISAAYISNPKNWPIFSIQFKQLLCSPNYLIKLNFIPVLSKFITSKEVKSTIFLPFFSDVENLILSMNLIDGKSKRVQSNGYNVFKIFVFNPRKTEQIQAVLKGNKLKILKILKDLTLDGEDSEQEKQEIINIIKTLK